MLISRDAFVRVLEASHGYVQRVARVLGCHRRTKERGDTFLIVTWR